MKLIPRGRTKALIGLALAASSVVAVVPLTSTAVQALPPGTPAAGTAALNLASGTNTSVFSFSLPVGASCPGDGPAGYRYGTYVTPISQDPATLTFSGLGSPIGPAITSAFRDTGGGFQRALLPGLVTGLVPVPATNPLTFVGLGTNPDGFLTEGSYNVGIACTLSGDNTRFWNNVITVTSTPGGFTWVQGLPQLAPSAPVLTGVSGLDVSFTQAPASPAVTGYTATVTPVNPAGPALAPFPVAAGATSFGLPGLDIGTEYSVTLVSTNSVGDSPPSNALQFLAEASFGIPVTALDVFDGDDVIVNWTAPGGPAPASYDVVITDSASAVVATQTGVAGLSATFPGIPLGADYTATVTGNYASPGASSTGQTTFSVGPNALIYQDITVERPQGALVLTQRCGVFGGFPAFDTSGWPGADLTLDPVAEVGGAGSAPTLVDALGNDTGTPDPLFTSYPQAGSYPTLCGVNLGAGELVTAGPLAGRFFVADGSINQVTVLDTRDGDLGWNAKGDVADLFTSGPAPYDENNSFSGDFLGWFPQVTSFSSGQSVTPGPAVGPGTSGGLTGNPTLASAPSGAGLGVATLDARLAVIIPVAADADTYTARLSLTVA